EIDDVSAGHPRQRLGPVDLLEHIRRQASDAIEFFHQLKLLAAPTIESSAMRSARFVSWVPRCASGLRVRILARRRRRLGPTGRRIGLPVAGGGQFGLRLLELLV